VTHPSPLAARPDTDSPIIVKLVGRVDDPRQLSRQLSVARPPSKRVRFTFDPDATRYDWLAVYDNRPNRKGSRTLGHSEVLSCPQHNTILLTSEPTSIKIYGRAFCRQFGAVISSQESWAIRSPGHVCAQSGLRWYYGLGRNRILTVDEMAAAPPLAKTRDVSIVCSTKAQGHTLHRQRLAFSLELVRQMPEIDHFGHGVRPMEDKAEALDAYRYHVAIENHLAPHHWTEKLADAFLGCTLPFYCGAPDAGRYFPPESFIAIDLSSPTRVADRIRAAIRDDEYSQRLPFIMEARRRVIEDYNMIALVARHAEAHDNRPYPNWTGRIMSQRAARMSNPLFAVEDLVLQARVQLQNRLFGTWR
jgi:hypothetical protein